MLGFSITLKNYVEFQYCTESKFFYIQNSIDYPNFDQLNESLSEKLRKLKIDFQDF